MPFALSRPKAVAILIPGLLAPVAAAQSYSLSWHSIDGGSGLSTGGGMYEIGGTIGQPDAGSLSGGVYVLSGGFWGGAFEITPSSCPGDTNNDRRVDLADLSTLLAHFGTPSGATPGDGDVDADGDVDLADLSSLLGNFGIICD